MIISKKNSLADYGDIYRLVLGSAIGLFYFIAVLGKKIINPGNLEWLTRGDLSYSFLGWHFFRTDSWFFPLGKMVKYGYPISPPITYTDSIPIIALLFKPFSDILPVNFQYHGIWLLSCFILQGIFSLLLISTVSKRLLVQIPGTIFLVISPILIMRMGHAGLCSHWLIIASLWLYCKDRESHYSSKMFLWWIFLTVFSAGVHPYITAMVMGLAAAFYLRILLNGKLISIFHFLVLILSVLTAWYILGYFGFGEMKNYGTAGFGTCSMNLISPINPNVGIELELWPESWSNILKGWPLADKWQCEGFNYLGIGVILLGIFAFFYLVKSPPSVEKLKFFFPLALVCLLFTLYALSNKITFGEKILFQYHFDGKINDLLSIFRVSGRFFWPVYYTIIFFIISIIVSRSSFRFCAFLLFFCLTLQIADFIKPYKSYSHYKTETTLNSPLKDDFWKTLGSKYDNLVLVPPDRLQWPFFYFAQLAANQNMSINTFFSARYDPKATGQYYSKLVNDLREGNLDDKSVYILNSAHFKMIKPGSKFIKFEIVDGFTVCHLME